MALEQSFVSADKNLHDLKGFDCGKTVMNQFLTRYAVKHGKLGLSRTYVLPEMLPETSPGPSPELSSIENSDATKKAIAAYYTLAFSSVTRSDIPATQSLPSYPIPVIMLARLAIDQRYQGRGLGGKALVYALRQAVRLNQMGLPAYGLILDVLDEQALAFYQTFDLFEPFTNDPMRLFVPLKTLETL